MKKTFLFFVVFVSAVNSVFGASFDKRPVLTGVSTPFGVFDPNGDFKNDPRPGIEHIFIPWEGADLTTLDHMDDYALQHKRSLLITVEPWSWINRSVVSDVDLYKGIMAGKYDANMAAICAKTAKFKSPVIIRWGHEMDYRDNVFPWSNWDPQQYINAYRHVESVCKTIDKTARFMWSPQGEKIVDIFYPGDQYVDMIGVSLFGLQKRDIDETGHDQSFEDLFSPIYKRLAHFNKPIYVAEFGYDGNDEYSLNWSKTVAQPMYSFPLLKAIIYYDQNEPYDWPNGYGKPNWRVVANSAVK